MQTLISTTGFITLLLLLLFVALVSIIRILNKYFNIKLPFVNKKLFKFWICGSHYEANIYLFQDNRWELGLVVDISPLQHSTSSLYCLNLIVFYIEFEITSPL